MFPSIGLEIHIELNTRSKMFCSCCNNPEEKRANFNICPICLGQPGVLPVINKKAIEMAIKTALSLNCKISSLSYFERKNYFYPDLPKGYQISQYEAPLCKEGYLIIPFKNKKIRIQRIHLEEDTGALLHPTGVDYSLIDFNRAGIPLMELVTEPDINSSKEASLFAQELQLILRYLGVSNADMEKGQMRIEANISVSSVKENRKNLRDILGTKVEIKNLNSFRALEKALEYEIERQIELLKNGKKILQETRGWDDLKKITFSQREKEESKDYRYFPEPDLPPLEISQKEIEEIKRTIPELPQMKRERFQKEYFLSDSEIEIFIKNQELSNFFEEIILQLKKQKEVSLKDLPRFIKTTTNYLQSDLQGVMKNKNLEFKNLKINPENFAQLILFLEQGKISSKVAKDLIPEIVISGVLVSSFVKEKGLVQIEDDKKIEEVVQKIIENNQKATEDFKKGKENALQYLIGQVMKETKGRLNPQKIKEIMIRVLKN